MRKYKGTIALFVVVVFVAALFIGCTAPPVRKVNPIPFRRDFTPAPGAPNSPTDRSNQSLINYPGSNNRIGSGGAGGNNSGAGTNGSQISSTYEVVDFSYMTPTAGNLTLRSGPANTAPSIGTIPSGQKVRTIGKVNDWYAVVHPTTGKVGCVPSNSLTPFNSVGAQGKTDTNSMAGATASGNTTGNTGTTTGTTSTTGKTATTGAAGTSSIPGSSTMSSDESRILSLCNAERSKAGLSALKSNGELVKLARMKSQDMVNKNYFSHQSPTYGSPFDMMKTYGVRYMYAGENIAMNQSADNAFKAWMNSEGHRKNIMNPNFTEIGIGIAPKGSGSFMYTQEFIGR